MNDGILSYYSDIKYTSLCKIYVIVVKARVGYTIVKKDVKDVFRNVPLSLLVY